MSQVKPFRHFIEHGTIKPDRVQLKAVEQLETIYAGLINNNKQKSSVEATQPRGFFSSLFTKKEKVAPTTTKKRDPVKGMYLWGGVGRGKTWLMDQFYESLTIQSKQRIHYHQFMYQVHERLEVLPKQPDPLEIIGFDMSQKYQVICLDEFHVIDIADAVILHGLLRSLFDNGVTLITTSNRLPDDLYKGGSRRERFIPAIELIKQNTHVFHLDSKKDYRLKRSYRKNTFLFPHDERINNKLSDIFKVYSNNQMPSQTPINVNGRSIPIIQSGLNCIWFNFDTLCRGMRASSDYVNIALYYKLVIISEIPILREGDEGSARRFLNMIDAFYDQHVQLILSSANDVREMYQGHRLGFEFQRAQSRLDEMQSQSWWRDFDREVASKSIS